MAKIEKLDVICFDFVVLDLFGVDDIDEHTLVRWDLSQ